MNKQTRLIVFMFCIIKLTLHLIADAHSGFQSDEFLHIETGNHLSFGYMEFPPMIGLLAFIQNLFHSQSIFIHHIFSHIASLIIIIYVAKTTIELSGKNIAVFIALFCLLIAPGFEGSQQSFQPVVFSQLFWVLSFYQLVRFIKLEDRKYLWYLTILTTLFFLTKYDALFFFIGLLSLLFFRRTRTVLIRDKFWQCLIISFIFLLPNLIWQYWHQFPALQMFHRLYETQLDDLRPISVLKDIFLSINPIVFILMLPSLVFMFADKGNKSLYKPIGFSIFLSLLFLAYSKGKAYYFYPLILTVLPFIGIFWEQIIQLKGRWLIYPLTIILIIGSVLIPFGMPVYSFPHYLATIYNYTPKNEKNGKVVMPMQEYCTKNNWERTMRTLQLVFDSLPADEKKNCLIWGKHYSQAGAVELLHNNYKLPRAFSYHGSFYTWAPRGEMPKTIIAFCYNDAGDDFFNPFFEQVISVRKVYSDYSSSEGWVVQTIYICKKPKQNFNQMKLLFKNRIFE